MTQKPKATREAKQNQQALIVQLIDSVAVMLAKSFHIPKPVVTTSNNPLSEFQRRAAGQKGTDETSYPFTVLKPRTYAVNQAAGYSPARMAKSPFTEILGRTSNGTMVATRFIPASVTIEVSFMSDDGLELGLFCANWIALAKAGKLNFDYGYQGVKLGIQVELSDSVDQPEIDQGEDINHGIANTTLVLHGYVELPGRPVEDVGMVTPKVQIRVESPNADPERFVTFAKVGS